MAAIHDLLAQIQDEELRSRIEKEVNKLSKTKKFGLVFEEHLPECTPLYDIPVKRGSLVAKRNESVSNMYTVVSINNNVATCCNKSTNVKEDINLDELVCVAEFGDPIYPYLKPIDSVCNAPESDLWHTLIEADNYHALQLLEYLYAGKVDCIYIDPPYNTGARDWKYNNDYVDVADSYRHSKWLSMIEKRLRIAKRLLNPDDSVMIITIDEKEYLHLGCLLEELFPEANIQMITDVINPKGVSRGSLFSRAEEYIFFVFLGNATINLGTNDMLRPEESKSSEIRWASLQRSGSNSRRFERPNLFYPIFFNKETDEFVSTGDSLPVNTDKSTVIVPEGQRVAFPLGKSDDERTWQLQQETFITLLKKGYVKFGNWQSDNKRTIYYLSSGLIKQIEDGEITVNGYDENGAVIISGESKVKPLSVWNKSSHSASDQGSSFISNILAGKRFTFPKSLYATHDALWFIVSNKPNALIVDFFAGSGTTLHAVNLMNAEDGGNRRCILVTNNEVSEAEAKELSQKGYKPGDDEWEKLGVARYVTWPRTVCSIEGHDVTGKELRGNYLGSDIPMAGGFQSNAIFFKLGFLDKNSVALGRQLSELIPLLWLKAGAYGKCPLLDSEKRSMWIFSDNRFAILVDEKEYQHFSELVSNDPLIHTVYIVTDSTSGYQDMISSLTNIDTYQLYRDYLDNFRINVRK